METRSKAEGRHRCSFSQRAVVYPKQMEDQIEHKILIYEMKVIQKKTFRKEFPLYDFIISSKVKRLDTILLKKQKL